MEPVFSAMALGFVLGLQHATDPDHLVAVATIVSRERRFADGAWIGALWGLGHTATLAVAGTVILGLGVALNGPVAAWLELLVAVMLVALGVGRLIDAARGLGAVPARHAVDHATDHEHAGVETLHTHGHSHEGRVHEHTHLHPSRRLLAALAPHRRFQLRALIVGAVHGMAGSAAISLLVLATVRSAAGVALYLALFGAGTIAGMTALTAAMAYPVILAVRFERARTALGVLAGVGSIAFGLFWGYRAM